MRTPSTGPGGSLYHPVGVSAANGTVYVSDTGANVVSQSSVWSTRLDWPGLAAAPPRLELV